MDKSIKQMVWRQFGASIDMLENAIKLCPTEFWNTDKKFWYWTYHCLFWLDYYLTLEPKDYKPQEPFSMSELESGVLPERPYTKEELLKYLEDCRNKWFNLISTLTDELSQAKWNNHFKRYPILELLLYNMRHVQHHAAQLNLLLRQEINDAPKWVSIADLEMN